MNGAFFSNLRVSVKTIAIGGVMGLLVISCGCEKKESSDEQPDTASISKAKNDSAAPKPSSLSPKDSKAPLVGGRTFSSDLHLKVSIVRKAGDRREWLGETPSARPLEIPRCASWGVEPIGRIDMEALAREIAAEKIARLRMTGASDGDLAHLKDLTGLQGLDLLRRRIWDRGPDPKITDAGMVHLGGLTGLRELNLARAQITDAGLVHLKSLTGLQELDLMWTKITDAGLVHLKGLTGLQRLRLWRTQITDAGAADLRKALPKAYIDH